MSINESIAGVISAVTDFQSQALDKAKPFKSRAVMLEATASTVDSIETFLTATGKEPSISGIRKKLKNTLNVVKGIQDGVQAKELKFAQMKVMVSGKLTEFLDDTITLQGNLKNQQALQFQSAGNSVELADLHDQQRQAKDADHATNTKDLFQKYRSKYLNKIPARLKNPGGIQVIELPIIAQFEQAAFMRSTTLQKLGIPFNRISSGKDYAGAAAMVVFEKQNLLMFSKSAAMDLAREEFEEVKESSDSKKNSTMRRNLNRQIKQKQSQIAQLFNKKTKDQQAKFIERMESEKGVNFSVLAKNLYKTPELYKEVMSSLKAFQKELAALKGKHDELDAKKKGAAHQLKAREKRMLDETSVLFTTASHTVEELSTRSSHQYTLITGTPMVNPKNSDLVMFWFIPTMLYKKMTSLTGGNMKITRWGLPWQGKAKMSKSQSSTPLSRNAKR